MEICWKYIIVATFIFMIVTAFILSRFIDKLEIRVIQLEKDRKMKIKNMSDKTRVELANACQSLTKELKLGGENPGILHKMKGVNNLFTKALEEMEV